MVAPVAKLVVEHVDVVVAKPVEAPVPELVITSTEGFTTPTRRVKTIAVKLSLVNIVYLTTVYC